MIDQFLQVASSSSPYMGTPLSGPTKQAANTGPYITSDPLQLAQLRNVLIQPERDSLTRLLIHFYLFQATDINPKIIVPRFYDTIESTHRSY